jgi:small ubiquitin-related modifier
MNSEQQQQDTVTAASEQQQQQQQQPQEEEQAQAIEHKSDPNSIEIKVTDQEGREILFRTKRDSPIEKMMNAYSRRQGVDKTAFRFLFDGQRIEAAQTPKELGMENGDLIDVVLSQTGGYILTTTTDIFGYSAMFL